MDWVGNGNKIQPLCVCVFWFRCSSSAQTKKGEETPAIDVAPSTVSTCNNQHEATRGMHNVGVTTMVMMMDRGTQNFKNLLPTDCRGRIMFRPINSIFRFRFRKHVERHQPTLPVWMLHNTVN